MTAYNFWHLFACRSPQLALVVKNWPAHAGDARDMGSVPRLGRCPAGGHGNPLQYPYRENPMDRGAWRVIPHRVAELDMTEVTEHACMFHLQKYQSRLCLYFHMSSRVCVFM